MRMMSINVMINTKKQNNTSSVKRGIVTKLRNSAGNKTSSAGCQNILQDALKIATITLTNSTITLQETRQRILDCLG